MTKEGGEEGHATANMGVASPTFAVVAMLVFMLILRLLRAADARFRFCANKAAMLFSRLANDNALLLLVFASMLAVVVFGNNKDASSRDDEEEFCEEEDDIEVLSVR